MSKTIVKYRLYPSCTYFALESWLYKMSKRGLHLVDYGLFKYVFYEGTPIDQTYFVYDRDSGNAHKDEGKYSLVLRYPNLIAQYAYSGKKCQLNKKSKQKILYKNIIAIDNQKKNLGYEEMVHDRNILYTLKTLRVIALFVTMTVCIYIAFFLL